MLRLSFGWWLVGAAVALCTACGDSSDTSGAASATTSGSGGSGAGVVTGGGGAGTSTGSGAASSGGGGSSGTWRPFSDASPWNTPIASAPALAPDSDALVADLASSTATWNYLNLNTDGYSIPVYYVDSASVAGVDVAVDIALAGFNPVPIPDGALPDPESDHHLAIVDPGARVEWGMWNAAFDGAWSASVAAKSDLSGDGIKPPITQASPWEAAVGARASGFALVAGLIRVEEVLAGSIDHALVIAYPHCRSRYFVSPASTAQGTNGVGATPDNGVPMGGRIQLDPAVDVEALPLTPMNKMIARALQVYGAFVGDYSGAISLYVENSPEAMSQWNAGLLDAENLRQVFDQPMLNSLRVLELGAMYDNGN